MVVAIFLASPIIIRLMKAAADNPEDAEATVKSVFSKLFKRKG